MKNEKVRYLSKEDALVKLQKYCSYQERNHREVRTKLLELGQRGYDVEWVMAELIGSGFLNEERYARAFARGKHRMNKWGRIKIQQALKMKNISDYCIKMGLSELNETEYLETLRGLIHTKMKNLTSGNSYEQKNKAGRFAIGKGYESQLVWDIINSMENEK